MRRSLGPAGLEDEAVESAGSGGGLQMESRCFMGHVCANYQPKEKSIKKQIVGQCLVSRHWVGEE